MNHIGAAVLLPQSIVDRANIEEQELARGGCVDGLEERLRRQIGDHRRDAALRQCNGRSRSIGASRELGILQREPLIQERPCRVVVVDREPRARHPIIDGWRLDQ
jgi:hypothetical protein